MGRRRLLAGRDLDVLNPRRDRPGCPAEVAPRPDDPGPLDGDRLDVFDIDDCWWPWRWLQGERGRSELPLEDELRRDAVDHSRQRADHAAADVRHPEAREADVLVVTALAEREHVERLERMHRVRAATGQVDDAVAGADLGGLARLPGEAAAAEHVEDLLLAPVLVGRRRPAAGRHFDPANADVHAAGSGADHRPPALKMADGAFPSGHLFEVCDPHGRDCTTVPGSASATNRPTLPAAPGDAPRSTRRAAARSTGGCRSESCRCRRGRASPGASAGRTRR